jgi:hypothetical protein
MKVAINVCFGGFTFSEKGCDYMVKNHNVRMFDGWDDLKENLKNGELYIVNDGNYKCSNVGETQFRTDKRVLDTIETLGDEASGSCSKLSIVEIPDGIEWEISEYDGNESVEESHRSWR